MLNKFGYVKLTHPQKRLPIFVDVLAIKGLEPYIFHEYVPAEKDEEGNITKEEEDRFHFISTVVKLDDKAEIHVKEKPGVVAKRMAEVMDGTDD